MMKKRAMLIMLALVLAVSLALTAIAGVMAGDVNGDGKITAFDAQMIAERNAGRRELTAEQAERAGTASVRDIISEIFSQETEPTEPPATTEPTEPPATTEPEIPADAIAAVTNDGETAFVTSVDQMKEAVSQTGNTQIKLLKDITLSKAVSLPYSCTMDLNGHTIATNPASGNGIEVAAAGTQNKTATFKNGTLIHYVVGIRVAAGAVVIDNMQIHSLNGPCIGIYDATDYSHVNSITNSTLTSPYACVAFNQKDLDFSGTGITVANTELISHGKSSSIFVKNGTNAKFGNVVFGENVNMYAYAAQPVASKLANTFFGGEPVSKTKETAAVTANGITYSNINCWTTELDPIKILMIGNSFCLSFTEELYALAEEAGKDIYIANLYYGGCSVERHWKSLTGEWSTVYNGYYITSSLGYGKHGTIFNIQDAIDFQDWDIISFQQHFDVQRTRTYEAAVASCTPYVENMYTYLREKFPQAKLYWHQTWAYEVGYKYPANRDDDPTNDIPNVDVSDVEIQSRQRDMIIAASDWISQTYKVDQIPCGSAWANARANPNIAEDPCKDDYCHDGATEGGQYLNACTWFETLFGTSCVGSQWRPGNYVLDDALAAELQKAAHQAVADMYGEDYAK